MEEIVNKKKINLPKWVNMQDRVPSRVWIKHIFIRKRGVNLIILYKKILSCYYHR